MKQEEVLLREIASSATTGLLAQVQIVGLRLADYHAAQLSDPAETAAVQLHNEILRLEGMCETARSYLNQATMLHRRNKRS